MVPLYLSMSLAHSSVSRRKSIGVTLTSSAPKYIGTVRNPVMPMSWNSGSQLTITSVSTLYSAPTNIASALDDQVAVGDLDRLGRPGRPGRQLHQRQVVLVGLDRVDRVGREQLLDRQRP